MVKAQWEERGSKTKKRQLTLNNAVIELVALHSFGVLKFVGMSYTVVLLKLLAKMELCMPLKAGHTPSSFKWNRDKVNTY